MPKQLGISPKLIADLIVSVGTYLLGHYAASIDPTTSALAAKALGTIAAYFTGPGHVGVVHETPPIADAVDLPDNHPDAV